MPLRSVSEPVLQDLTLSEFAPAKVNLSLHITGQRQDGYHLLDSLVCFAGIGDRLTARRAEAFSLEISGPFGRGLTAGPDNLILRAARIIAPDLPLAFTLEKNLPLASGIGGGSSDAAAAVRLAWALRGSGEQAGEVAALAALGADIPACLQPRAARMRGIGEQLEPLSPLPPGWILLVNPRVEVATPGVFRALRRKQNPALPEVLPLWADMAELAGWLSRQRNDLEAPARQLAPVIAEVIAALEDLPGQLLARMSGSGASCFALFAEAAAADAAAAALQAARPGWWVAAAPLS
ncbi:4-(cytidine 5'-diphospho)-2-C-methyl-D-erythritol kinase [Pseudogemmobacter sp. CC-YST710]|uniref:4-diphosphocytidyl-2-C-methyl-D-erythritol kinase n=1 Tax=Pseudogemmobacter faecipullorum TaxID=2755041 RepID=A0ABS8CHQ5_9RHOB|nr:4-(cytidine 5'-diphospho)-2-C-methyl-D-erythritol kinase [Pseudogemmobacter faecipullorum]MCB5408921.1 4-(cytidine 5'-diphospho)-2-C-methyl-D-erythritol kinase [Pseudogemmobacter faecipullorum]